jgi:hypothetical protein
MAENTSRGVFSLNGVTGMLIATVLLLSILVGLTIWGIAVQQGSAQNPYDTAPVLDQNNVRMNSVDNAQFSFPDVKE